MRPMPKGGRTHGARDKFSRALLEDLLAEWREGGRTAVQQMRLEKPAEYVRAMIAVLPRELLFESSNLADLDDAQLDDLIAQIKQHLLAARQAPALIEGEVAKETDDELEPA